MRSVYSDMVFVEALKRLKWVTPECELDAKQTCIEKFAKLL